MILFFPLPGNYIQSCVKVLWMWLFPVSSLWTTVVTPHLLPLLLIRPPHPPRSPPTPAPLPNWGRLFTLDLSLDCKHTNSPHVSSPLEASSWSALIPKLVVMSSTRRRPEPLNHACHAWRESFFLQSCRDDFHHLCLLGMTYFLGDSKRGQTPFYLTSSSSPHPPSRLLELW